MGQDSIIVVGGGHGGSQVVASLRSEGYEGRLTLITAETDIPYQRPPLSKAFLKKADHELLPLRPASFYEKNAIDLQLGTEAVSIDRRGRALLLGDNRRLPFDRLVLAPGARPRLPAIDGIRLDGVFALRDASDARRIRDQLFMSDSIVVVGGGFIGLEIAATARLLGKRVTVLEAADRLMGRVVARQISEYFLSLHRGWGTDVRLNTPVGHIVGSSGGVAAVETAMGDRIDADMAIIGIGVEPNIELGESAGLATDNGIVVDKNMTTSAGEIYAIGDCAAFEHWELGRRVRLESVQNAVDQAKATARALVGKAEPYRDVPWFWSDQGDFKLQMVGLSNNATSGVVRGIPDDGTFSVFHFDNDRLVAIDSVNRAADHMVGRRMLAAGISPSPEACADPNTDLKALIRRPASG
ncbi:MAG: FAD-dependent oxidoreductase [Hyphomicrobiales bacterium]|nr:FAD-dependent oxidoreductase [Hyphomicrobiales bacterium]